MLNLIVLYTLNVTDSGGGVGQSRHAGGDPQDRVVVMCLFGKVHIIFIKYQGFMYIKFIKQLLFRGIQR